jgi:hypothetical protein
MSHKQLGWALRNLVGREVPEYERGKRDNNQMDLKIMSLF